MNNKIKWNIINSGLAGALVFLGSAIDGNITTQGVCIAFVTGLAVALTRFKEYWTKIPDADKGQLFSFI